MYPKYCTISFVCILSKRNMNINIHAMDWVRLNTANHDMILFDRPKGNIFNFFKNQGLKFILRKGVSLPIFLNGE